MKNCGALLIGLGLLTACGRSQASDTSCFFEDMPTAPPDAVFEEVNASVEQREWPEGESLVVDLEQCDSARWFASLPFGSAWVVTRGDGSTCEVWLGGETENPLYDGDPTQYCRFERDGCEATIETAFDGDGGPARIESDGCIDL